VFEVNSGRVEIVAEIEVVQSVVIFAVGILLFYADQKGGNAGCSDRYRGYPSAVVPIAAAVCSYSYLVSVLFDHFYSDWAVLFPGVPFDLFFHFSVHLGDRCYLWNSF
jgi:hypothetical protein